jgi:NAD(P)-dependent dehydrogenase (short-subunit alcohol dehydrogenase family)
MLAHQTYDGTSAYVSSKAGLEGLTRALAIEHAPDRVRVNAVVPGLIHTGPGPSTPRGRWLREIPVEERERWRALRRTMREHHWRLTQPWPEPGQADHVAAAILFLLSDAASFITGACLSVDGGTILNHPRVMSLPFAELAQVQAEMHAIGKKYQRLRVKYAPNRQARGRAGRKRR